MSAPEGRCRYDLLTALDYEPTRKKPYRVVVWEWDYWRKDEDGLKWTRPLQWNRRDPEHERHFRTLRAALKYKHRAEALGDERYLLGVVDKESESRRVVLL